MQENYKVFTLTIYKENKYICVIICHLFLQFWRLVIFIIISFKLKILYKFENLSILTSAHLLTSVKCEEVIITFSSIFSKYCPLNALKQKIPA